MNDAQRARLATMRELYRNRGMDVHGSEQDDNVVHVVIYGRITGAEVEVHTIDLDGLVDAEAPPQ